MQIAIRHPELVDKLILGSALCKRRGVPAQFWEFMKKADISNMPPELKEGYLKVSPNPEGLQVMHDKDAARMRTFKDVPDDAIRAVRAPTLIMMGDRDVVTLEHTSELMRLFPNARLLVLPGGHGEYLGEVTVPTVDSGYPELTAQLIARFLAAP